MTPIRRVPRTKSRPKSAFTLIEMLSVIAVILILIGIAVPNVLGALERARNTQCRVLLQSLKAAVASYHTDTRQWPESGSDRLYLILGGYDPFSAKSSKRYKPPYVDFQAGAVASDEYEDPSNTGGYVTKKIQLVDYQGRLKDTIEKDDIFDPIQDLQGKPLPWRPVLDPWERPIIYISPEILRKRFNDDVPSQSSPEWKWYRLVALDKEIAVTDKIENDGSRSRAYVPFGLNSGQFWSTGRDGMTAERDELPAKYNTTDVPIRGYFQPGNLLGYDRRDNDVDPQGKGDGRVDETDFKSKGGNVLVEDDLASW